MAGFYLLGSRGERLSVRSFSSTLETVNFVKREVIVRVGNNQWLGSETKKMIFELENIFSISI